MLSSAKSNQLVWHNSSAVFPFSTYMTKAFSVSLQLCTTYRRKSGKARASVSYARLTSFPHTKRGGLRHSRFISTRGEFNSFFARVEGRDDQCFHTSLDNCLLCKWKQQSHYCSLLSAKAIYTKSRTTKCKSGLGLLCALGLTLLYCLGRTIPKWNIFLIVVFCLFFCDVYTLFQIRWKRSHFTTLRAKRAIAIFLLFFIVPRWRF